MASHAIGGLAELFGITAFGGGQLVKTFRQAVQENGGGFIC